MALRGTHHRNRSGNPIGIARGTSNNEPAASQTLAGGSRRTSPSWRKSRKSHDVVCYAPISRRKIKI